MIIEVLITIITYLLSFFAWILPEWAIPEIFLTSTTDLIHGVFAWDYILPITEVSQVMLAILGFEIAIIVSRSVLSLVSLVRGGGEIKI